VVTALWHQRRGVFSFTRPGLAWFAAWLAAAIAGIALAPIRFGTGELGDPVPVPALLPLLALPLLVLTLRRCRPVLPLALTYLVIWYVAVVIAVTLLPLQIQTGDFANHVPWYDKDVHVNPFDHAVNPLNFAFNICMTVPLGLLAPIATRLRGPVAVVLLTVAFSATIEIVQAVTNIVFSSGRTADVHDLVANTVGGIVGYGVYRTLNAVGALRWLSSETPSPVTE
jgi:glycopeptide antibiotics resistance protein